MKKRRAEILTVAILALVILSIGLIGFCAPDQRRPEPVIQTVEVTRVVPQPVTAIQTVEVTREVERTQTVYLEVTRTVDRPYPVYVNTYYTPTPPATGRG